MPYLASDAAVGPSKLHSPPRQPRPLQCVHCRSGVQFHSINSCGRRLPCSRVNIARRHQSRLAACLWTFQAGKQPRPAVLNPIARPCPIGRFQTREALLSLDPRRKAPSRALGGWCRAPQNLPRREEHTVCSVVVACARRLRTSWEPEQGVCDLEQRALKPLPPNATRWTT